MLVASLEPFSLKLLPFLGADHNSLAGLDEVAAWLVSEGAEPPVHAKFPLDFGQQLCYVSRGPGFSLLYSCTFE